MSLQLIRSEARVTRMRKVEYKKILVTHDGSKFASAALPHAAALAHATGAEVTLLHIVDSVGQVLAKVDPMAFVPAPTLVYEGVLERVAEEETESFDKLERLRTRLEEAGAKEVATEVVQGPTGEAIIEVSKKENFDLIVMSTHGRTGVARAVLGSIADHVVHNSPCPVLLIRPE